MPAESARIYVLWHPGFKLGSQLAGAVFNWFRLKTGFGIPVYYRSQPCDGTATGAPIEIPQPEEPGVNLIVLLADEHMVSDYTWRDWLVSLASSAEDRPHSAILYPVAFHPAAYKLPAEIRRLNYISPWPSPGRGTKLEPSTPEAVEAQLLKRLTEAFARILVRRDLKKSLPEADTEPPKIKVFISHAKADGTDEARAIRDYIYQETQLSAFFDENDIALGYTFSRVLQDTLRFETAALIAIQSDRYADRPWCRREIQLFRKPVRPESDRPDIWKLHPVLLIEAMKGKEISRAIPELGNSPSIRWQDGDEHRYIDALLRETILRSYHLSHAQALPQVPKRAVLNWASDPLSVYEVLRDAPDTTQIVYPDGGLAGLDLDALQELFPKTNFITYREAES